MSLWWSSYVTPKSPKGGSKTQNSRFLYKIAPRLKKVCYKIPLYENCQRQSCKAFISITIRAKMNGAVTPPTWNFGSKWLHWSEIPNFRSIFACSASASALHLANKVQWMLIGSPLRAFQWAQDEHRTLSQSPKTVAEKRKVSRIWTISCNNSETVPDRMSVTINH